MPPFNAASVRCRDLRAGNADTAAGVRVAFSCPATAAGAFCGASGGFCCDAAGLAAPAAVTGASAATCAAIGSGVAAAAGCWGAGEATLPVAVLTTRVSPSRSPSADSSAVVSAGSYGAQHAVNLLHYRVARKALCCPRAMPNAAMLTACSSRTRTVERTQLHDYLPGSGYSAAAYSTALLQLPHLHRTRREAGQQLLCRRRHASAVGEQGLEVQKRRLRGQACTLQCGALVTDTEFYASPCERLSSCMPVVITQRAETSASPVRVVCPVGPRTRMFIPALVTLLDFC